MAATATKSRSTPDLKTATERAREANDRLAEVSRKVTTAYLDGIEKYVAEFGKFERKLGEQTKFDAATSVLNTHAKLTQDVTKSSVSAARQLIAA